MGFVVGVEVKDVWKAVKGAVLTGLELSHIHLLLFP
jgi:hypothetical protein